MRSPRATFLPWAKRLYQATLSRVIDLFFISASACACLTKGRGDISAEVRRVAIVRFDGIGDGILTLPLIREISRCFPGAELEGVFSPPAAAFLESCGVLDTVVAVPSTASNLLGSTVERLRQLSSVARSLLARGPVDIVFCPRYGADPLGSRYLGCLLAGRRVAGFAIPPAYKYVLGHPLPKDEVVKHEVERGLDCLRSLGKNVSNEPFQLAFRAEELESARRELREISSGRRLVALSLGANDLARQWPVARFIEALQIVNSREPIALIAMGRTQEAPEMKELLREVDVPSVALYDRPLIELAAYLHLADLFLGNDSGPGHLAAISGCPCVVVSKHWVGGDVNHANSPARFIPHIGDAVALQPSKPAPPCSGFCDETRYPHCILDVQANDVAAAVLTLLSSHKMSPAGQSK